MCGKLLQVSREFFACVKKTFGAHRCCIILPGVKMNSGFFTTTASYTQTGNLSVWISDFVELQHNFILVKHISVCKKTFLHIQIVFLHICKKLLHIHKLKILRNSPFTNSKCDVQLQVVKELVNLIFHAQSLFFNNLTPYRNSRLDNVWMTDGRILTQITDPTLHCINSFNLKSTLTQIPQLLFGGPALVRGLV